MISQLNFEQGARSWILRNLQKRQMIAAIRRTYRQFTKQNPMWVKSLFDEHFIVGRAWPAFKLYSSGKKSEAATHLANSWVDQMLLLNEEKKQGWVAEIRPIVSEFLASVAAEMAISPGDVEKLGSWQATGALRVIAATAMISVLAGLFLR